LLTDLQQFDELVELTDEWSNAPGLTEGARAARKLALAELDTALGRYDEAIEAYRSALAAGFHAPFWGLSRLLQGLQRFEDRAALLRTHLERTTDLRTRNYLRAELARLLAGPLDAIDE